MERTSSSPKVDSLDSLSNGDLPLPRNDLFYFPPLLTPVGAPLPRADGRRKKRRRNRGPVPSCVLRLPARPAVR